MANHDEASSSWRKRPSEMRGYNRSYNITTSDRDYIRLDYNIKEKKVRLYIELNSEGGNGYFSIIEDGKIKLERSVSTGRNFGFEKKFANLSSVVNSLPNREVLKLFNKHYGILFVAKPKPINKKEKAKRLAETKKKYFADNINPYNTLAGSSKQKKATFSLVDLIDFTIGLGLMGVMFIVTNYSVVESGVLAAFYGVAIGFIDMFFREREPIFSKILFFVIVGIFLYIYGFFM